MKTYQPLFEAGALETAEERRAAFRRLAAIFGASVVVPSAAVRAATQEREAERTRRIEADHRQRQAKLQEQQAEATQRREALTQGEQLEALFPSDHFGG